METLANITYRHQQLPLSLHHRRPSFSKPISSLSFTISKSPSFSSSPVKASFFYPLLPNPKTPKPKTLTTPLPISFLKTTFIAGVTVTTLFFSRFTLMKPVIAAPISPPPTVDTSSVTDAVSDEENERNLEEYVNLHPDDVKALRNLMELKIKNKKVNEAIVIIDQLIKLQPNDTEWPLLKAHIHTYGGDYQSAKLEFNEILSKDPLRVEAYHGLVMAASNSDDVSEMKDVEKRVVEGMEKCKKERKKEDVRDFKLLLAQIRVIEGDYNDALKIYQELAKEEPRDFRPHLCQGIIYTLLKKNDDAEKSFQKYRRLVPKAHPYAQYFEENMIASKVFAGKMENERAYAKS